MLRGMDDLDLAVAHLHNTIEHLPPLAQEALRDAILHIERARSLSVSSDLSALTSMAPLELGTLLRTRREASGLSQRRLSELSGLSDRTIKHLEQGEQTPTLDTLRRLAGVAELELHQDIASRSTSGQHRALPNSWLLPRYDRRVLMAELQARANTNGAALEQTMLYLDDQSAQDYLDLCGSDAFAERFRSLPMAESRRHHHRQDRRSSAGPQCLGPGDGRTEVALAVELVNRTTGKLRLHLLDISHPLLVIANNRATEQLGDRAQVQTLHGDFHHIWRYPVFLPQWLGIESPTHLRHAGRIRSRTSTMKWPSFATSLA